MSGSAALALQRAVASTRAGLARQARASAKRASAAVAAADHHAVPSSSGGAEPHDRRSMHDLAGPSHHSHHGSPAGGGAKGHRALAGLPAAVAHAQMFSRPLTAPIVEPSHTSISMPLGSIDLYGNYSIQGPALIRKVNNGLVALVQPGGSVSLTTSQQEGPTTMDSASLSHDAADEASALCHLMGHHVMLDGRFILQGEAGLTHDGKTILSVSHLSEDEFCCQILPGGVVSHPVNVCPHPPVAPTGH